MKRLADENINTPEYHDGKWLHEGKHPYDAVRLREFLKHVHAGSEVLDVGAGLNGFAQYAIEHNYPGVYAAVDYSEEARRRTLAHLESRGIAYGFKFAYFVMDAMDMRFYERRFDIVGCGEMIEHFDLPETLVAQLARFCKPGGRIIISTLNPECENARGRVYPDHVWQFEPADLVAYLSPYGPTTYRAVGDYHFVECKVKRNQI